ncbi:MAG: septum formation protein Maf [Gammaproteobacteria bacterium]|nr:septum formation protein Maf [Gammaproteobacteria bacterium]
MLILASTSPYRRALLERLQLPFTVEAPEVDESPLAGETPKALAARLAEAKAQAVAARHAGIAQFVIGSDQVADRDGEALGKPRNIETAAAQLAALSGRSLLLHTGLCVVDCRGGRRRTVVDSHEVRFRKLDAAAIRRYLAVEQPLDAAGSFYAEGFGIVLFESFHGRDPNSIVGLPLMALVDLLADFGVRLP